ncbi:MAG: sulfatase-like hydrolase/transferase [Rubrobacter sp.]|nr:sulfatase-like hydrolase/transferase [Rubrobacter sp.]
MFGSRAHNSRGRSRRPQSPLLDGGSWVYLLALIVPLFTYDLSLKLVRILARPQDPELYGVLQLLRSDVMFALGYATLWVGIFIVARHGAWRRIATASFHIASVLIAALSTATHFYYQDTGSSLSLELILYYLSAPGEIRSVVASRVEPALVAFGLLVLLYAVLGPWLLTRALDRGVPSAPLRRDSARTPWLGLAAAIMAAGGLFLFSFPANPQATGASESFIRAPLVNLVSGEIEEASYERQVDIDAEAVRQSLPDEASLARTPSTGKRNVVLIQLESTRARSVTPYESVTPSGEDGTSGEDGAGPEITPFLDRLARQSLVAENAYAAVPHTTNSLAAINCGIYPPSTPRATDGLAEDVPSRCMPKLLEEQGYNTAFFQSATENFESRRAVVNNFGYEDFFPLESMDKEGYERANYFSYEDDIMLEPSRRWLQQNKDQPFMATYLTGTAHDDYGVPSRYGMKNFSEDPLLNRYQNTVRYQDFFVKNLIQQYKQAGEFENTVFVITGDHGEAFGEHGRFQHDKVPYEEGVRIPIMILDPQRQDWTNGGARVDEPANQLNLLPSVMGLLGYRIEGGEYPGEALWNLAEDRTLNFSCWGTRECLASLEGDMKYIYNYGDRPDELYDLSRDPLEQNNLLAEASTSERQQADNRREELLTWRAKLEAIYGG